VSESVGACVTEIRTMLAAMTERETPVARPSADLLGT
jgi:hypothetical protein